MERDPMDPRLLACLCVAAAAVAFLLFPAVPGDTPALLQGFLARGLVAGTAAGLLARRGLQPSAAALLAAAAVGIGLVLLAPRGTSAGFAALAAPVLLAALSALGTTALCRSGRTELAVGLALAAVVGAFFWQAGVIPGPAAERVAPTLRYASEEPANGSYYFDGQFYLKTYWLVRGGEGYYQAFTDAWRGYRVKGQPPGKLNHRQPWLTWLWLALPGPPGLAVWYGFVGVAVLAMLAAFYLASAFVDPAVALLAPIGVGAYYTWPALGLWFPFSEYWASAAAILAVALVVRRRWLPGAVAVVVAIAFRELMVFLIPAFAVAWWLYPQRRREVPALLVATVLPVALYAAHLAAAPAGRPADPTVWLRGGFGPLLAALRFSADFVPFGAWVLPVVPLVAVLGALALRPGWRAAFLGGAVGTAAFGLFAFSAGVNGAYWGAILQPLALAAAPLALARVLPARAAAEAGEPAEQRRPAA